MPTRQEEEEAIKARERAARTATKVTKVDLANVISDSDSLSMTSPSGKVRRSVDRSMSNHHQLQSSNANPQVQMTREEEEIMIKERERNARRINSKVPNLASMVEQTTLMSPSGNQNRPRMTTGVAYDGPPVMVGAVTVPPLVTMSDPSGTLTREEEERMIKQRERDAMATSRVARVPNLASIVQDPGVYGPDSEISKPVSTSTLSVGSSSPNMSRQEEQRMKKQRERDSMASSRGSNVSNASMSRIEEERMLKERERALRSQGSQQGSFNSTSRENSVVPNLSHLVETSLSRDPSSTYLPSRTDSIPTPSSPAPQSQQEKDIQQKEREREAGSYSMRESVVVPNLASQVSMARYDVVAEMLGEQGNGQQLMQHEDSFNSGRAQNSQATARPSVTYENISEENVRARYQAATLALGNQMTQEEEDELLKEREHHAKHVGQKTTPSAVSRAGLTQYERDLESKIQNRDGRERTSPARVSQATEDRLAKGRGSRNQRLTSGDNDDLIAETVPQIAPGALAVADGQAEIRSRGALTRIEMPGVQDYVAPAPSNRSFSDQNDGIRNSDVECRTQANEIAMAQASTTGASVSPVQENISVAEANVNPVGVEERKEDKEEPRSKRKWYILVAVLLLAIGAVVGVIASGGGGGGESSGPVNEDPTRSPTMAPTFAPETGRLTEARDILISAGISSEESLRDFESAQYAAMRWVADEDTDTSLGELETFISRYALAVFFYSMNGQEWQIGGNDEWLEESSSECDWAFIECRGGAVDAITVEDPINLDGTLPSELNALPFLRRLLIQNNEVAGIASAIDQLEFLDLENCKLSERFRGIPPEILTMTNLRTLYLPNNALFGTISAGLESLSLLERLDLGENDFTGTLTTQFSKMSNLADIDLAQNDFAGNVMSVIEGLFNLRALYVGSNRFTGQIDSRIADFQKLQRFEVEENELSGPFPNALFEVTTLQSINLSSNDIAGALATEIGLLNKLNSVALSSMQLTGTLPTEIAQLEQLIRLEIRQTQLSGIIPTEFGAGATLRRLERIFLDSNFLTGPIPTQLALLPKLTQLELGFNFLTGTLPTELGELSSLQRLTVAGNDLEGDVPAEVCAISNINWLAVSPLICSDCAKCTG